MRSRLVGTYRESKKHIPKDNCPKIYIYKIDYKGSSATRDSVGQPSTDENNCDNGFAMLEAQTLTVQAVPT